MNKIYLIFFLGVLFLTSGCSIYQQNNSLGFANYNIVETKIQRIAKEWKKTPYKLGGTTKKGADCSGFTQSVLFEFKTRIPRTTKTQLESGESISKKNLKAGDLVFFKTGRGPNGMHVGIYLSNNKFIHLSTKGGAKEASLNNAYWKKRYIGARRYNLKVF
ncbi:C40 family peptidase [Campylobacter sp. TTU_617]|uniref:C40 family peptidase n=1 Tax=Campylobacter sp. TTU_617 TaxID=2768148 RepID=UPI001904F213|nr:NlpC/P60 family protein [Campylobacter sp. TTU_617]MBK1971100.1 C40 family peptidase [Campylobacter sp. TTU_617]